MNETGATPVLRPSSLLDTRVIYCGDNLEQLAKLPDACVDLIYIDPPKANAEGRRQNYETSALSIAAFFIFPSEFTRERQLLLPLRLARQPPRQSHARPDFRGE